tara:strand:+ start:160 stop:1662 length:1503 start_codon:yes stop_codon:yes gene_type:complete
MKDFIKSFLFLLIALSNTVTLAQNLNQFKAVYVQPFTTNGSTDAYGIQAEAYRYFNSLGLKNMNEVKLINECEVATVSFYTAKPPNYWNCGQLGIKIQDRDGEEIYNKILRTPNVMSAAPYYECYMNWKRAINNTNINLSYSYVKSNSECESKKIIIVDKDSINLTLDSSIKNYFDNYGANLYEGIWEVTSVSGGSYRLAVFEENDIFQAYTIEQKGLFFVGDKKAKFEPASSEQIVTVNWTMGDKQTIQKTVGTFENDALIKFSIGNSETLLYKVYPKFNTKKRNGNGDWYGNGSGIVISKNGYIITNNHVIEDANDIEVELLVDSEVQKYNAEIVQVDKTNDLAILKILDVNFDGLNQLSYNFKSRSSDVGTKVYAFGYPMALTIMGKEIKVTDGIISSKTGFDGDITTYQITAPIQAGNSGGPLFDDKGNLIGINSSGLRKDVADNVGYSIKTSYVLNLIDILPKSIDLPSSTKLSSLPLTEQIKEISKYVVLIKVK